MDRQNAIFDESGHFLIYCTMLGVKVVNLFTNQVARVLGRHENVRFLQATLFQASGFLSSSGISISVAVSSLMSVAGAVAGMYPMGDSRIIVVCKSDSTG